MNRFKFKLTLYALVFFGLLMGADYILSRNSSTVITVKALRNSY